MTYRGTTYAHMRFTNDRTTVKPRESNTSDMHSGYIRRQQHCCAILNVLSLDIY